MNETPLVETPMTTSPWLQLGFWGYVIIGVLITGICALVFYRYMRAIHGDNGERFRLTDIGEHKGKNTV